MRRGLLTEISKRVHIARQRANLTQAQLAEAAGLTDETVSRIERGTYEPALSTMMALADTLEVSVDELIGRARQRRAAAIGSRTPLARKLAERAAGLSAEEQRALLLFARLLSDRRAKG